MIVTQIEIILYNDHTRYYKRPYDALIVLVAKPYQEIVVNIKDFVWRMYVSYRAINTVTRPFHFPVGRCSDTLDDLGDNHGQLCFISLDTRSGYYQVYVRTQD